jgi:hypothetical protein
VGTWTPGSGFVCPDKALACETVSSIP